MIMNLIAGGFALLAAFLLLSFREWFLSLGDKNRLSNRERASEHANPRQPYLREIPKPAPGTRLQDVRSAKEIIGAHQFVADPRTQAKYGSVDTDIDKNNAAVTDTREIQSRGSSS